MATLGDVASDVGLGLRAFSAGVAGDTQFNERRDAKKEKLSEERKSAFLFDLGEADKLIKRGDIQGAARFLGETRINSRGAKGRDMSQSLELASILNSADPSEAMAAIDSLVSRGISMRKLPARATGPSAFEIAKTAKVERETALLGGGDPSALDRARAGKLIAETAKLEADASGGGRQIKAPQALLKDLSPGTKAKARAAFIAAGGGKDGVKALNAQVAISNTSAQREEIPALLQSSFPNATEEEMIQLSAAAQSGKTVESGLKEASKVRSEQKRVKKASGFQRRAITVLRRVLENPELNDVLGSVEGGDSAFLLRSDGEAEAIADISEAGDILTADNLDIMTGVLSETDIKIIRNLAGGGLNRKRSEKRFRADVEEVIARLEAGNVTSPDNELEALRAKHGL